MALAFDTATDGGNNGGSTSSLTFAHTCTGSDGVLVVGIAGDLAGGADDVTGVTYNGVAMSFVAKVAGEVSQNRNVYHYVLAAPATGAHNVVVSISGTHFILAGAMSYTGASSSQVDASTTNRSGAGDTTLASSITTIANNCWATLVEQGVSDASVAPSASTGATRRTYDATYGVWGLFDSNAAVTPAGSYSMTTTRDSLQSYKIMHVLASLAPAAAAPSGGAIIFNMQIG